MKMIQLSQEPSERTLIRWEIFGMVLPSEEDEQKVPKILATSALSLLAEKVSNF